MRRRGKWYGRASYLDPVSGKQKFRERLAPTNTKTEAKRIGAELAREIEAGTLNRPARERTFEDLATFYREHYLTAAVVVDGHRISGLRSLASQRSWLKPLVAHFGQRKLSSVTYAAIQAYRTKRLATPAKGKRTRALGSVNRELAVLHRMFNIAIQERWLDRSPFADGKPLMEQSRETKRERVLSEAEEMRLLAACDGREALRRFLICAIDTGMRKNEIQTLRWSDVDLLNGVLSIQMHNTKTERAREAPITTRLDAVLRALLSEAEDPADGLVFGRLPQHQFVKVRDAAGLPMVRLHDLRHTTATRLVNRGMPLADVGRILGHSQPQMTYRYSNLTRETVRRAAELLSGELEETGERIN